MNIYCSALFSTRISILYKVIYLIAGHYLYLAFTYQSVFDPYLFIACTAVLSPAGAFITRIFKLGAVYHRVKAASIKANAKQCARALVLCSVIFVVAISGRLMLECIIAWKALVLNFWNELQPVVHLRTWWWNDSFRLS